MIDLETLARTGPASALLVCFLAASAAAEEPVVIDGLVEETLNLPNLGHVVIVGPNGEINAPDGRGIDANVGTTIRVDGGRVEGGSGNAIAARAHAKVYIVNGADIASSSTTAINLSEFATVLVDSSMVGGRISADDYLDIQIINADLAGDIRGNSHSRVRLVNASVNDIRLDDDVLIEVINSTVMDRIDVDSNITLLVDEQSTLLDRVIADHNLDFELRGTMDFSAGGNAAISGASNFNVHLRGGAIIGSANNQRGFGIGQAGTIRLSEGASIQTSSHAIEMTDSGTIILEPGSLLSSSGAASVRHLNGLTLSATESTLIGTIDVGRSSIINLHNTTVEGMDRAIRVNRGSRVTLTGEATSITSQNRQIIDLGRGSVLTMLAGTLSAPSTTVDTCRGINLDRGAQARIHGGSLSTVADGCEGIYGNRSKVLLDGGSVLTQGDNSPGIRYFTESKLRLSGSATITTTGDRISDEPEIGAHGIVGSNSIVDISGGQIDIQGSGNFGLLGLDSSVYVVRGGQVMAESSLGSFGIGAFDDAEIRLLGLADAFTIDISGDGEGPLPVELGVGDSVSLADLYPDFNDTNTPLSGVIAGTWSNGDPFALTFTNQYAGLGGLVTPGTILLRGVAEPDPSTSAVINSQQNPSEIEEAVVFTAAVTNPESPPEDGQVTIIASSGESCSGEGPAVSGNTATWSCEITFNSVGTRAVSAEYSGSEQFDDATSAPLTQTVNLGLFIDRFEEI